MQQEDEKRTSLEFLNELRTQFERDIDLRKSLDSKTNTMITMSSTIVTILIAIGTFLVSHIEPKNEIFFYAAIAILGLGISLATVCIVFLTRSYFLRSYTYPMGHEKFYDNGIYKKEVADKFLYSTDQKFADQMVRVYLKSIKENAETTLERTGLTKRGQRFLVPAMISIAVLVGFVLVVYGLGIITLRF